MNFCIHTTGMDKKAVLQRPHRMAVVCEGGGQRGIFTAGILDRFLQRRYFPFHTLIGVSAGAQNLAAYACDVHGYAHHAISRYTTDKRFF